MYTSDSSRQNMVMSSSSSTSLRVDCEVKLKRISNDKENGRIVVVAVIVPSSLDIVIIVVPGDTAVMMPAEIVATDSSLLVHRRRNCGGGPHPRPKPEGHRCRG